MADLSAAHIVGMVLSALVEKTMARAWELADEVMPAREVSEHTVRRPRILQGLFSSAPSLELTVHIFSASWL